MKVSSTELQNNFGRYLKFVEASEEIIVTRNGRDVARITPVDPKAGQVRESMPAYRMDEDWISYEEFLQLTENSDQRYELIDGVMYNLASPTYGHQQAVIELSGTFYNWFKGKSCTPLTSPFDVTLVKSEDNICVVQPDVLVICDKDNIDQKGKYHGIPTLIVEVLSPSTQRKDISTKLELYIQCGVKEYWIVDTKHKQITVHLLDEQDITDYLAFKVGADEYARSFHFDGLSVKLDDVFA